MAGVNVKRLRTRESHDFTEDKSKSYCQSHLDPLYCKQCERSRETLWSAQLSSRRSFITTFCFLSFKGKHCKILKGILDSKSVSYFVLFQQVAYQECCYENWHQTFSCKRYGLGQGASLVLLAEFPNNAEWQKKRIETKTKDCAHLSMVNCSLWLC